MNTQILSPSFGDNPRDAAQMFDELLIAAGIGGCFVGHEFDPDHVRKNFVLIGNNDVLVVMRNRPNVIKRMYLRLEALFNGGN